MAAFAIFVLVVFISGTNGKLVYKSASGYYEEIPQNHKPAPLPTNHKSLADLNQLGQAEMESLTRQIQHFPRPEMGHSEQANWGNGENLEAYYKMNNWHSDALKRVGFAEDERADLLGISPKHVGNENLNPTRGPPAQMKYYVPHIPPVLPGAVFKPAKKFSSKYRKLPKKPSLHKKKLFQPTLPASEFVDDHVRQPLKDKKKTANVRLVPTSNLNSISANDKDTPISWARQEHFPEPNHLAAEFRGSPHGERIHFQMYGMNGPHSYKFGYDTGKGHNRQFRFEERDNAGKVSGHYGHYDQHGRMSMVKYEADPHTGYHAKPHQFYHHHHHR